MVLKACAGHLVMRGAMLDNFGFAVYNSEAIVHVLDKKGKNYAIKRR